MISRQDYYDRLCKAAVDGTFPSYQFDDKYSNKAKCMYKKGEHKCAFGILILDGKYSKSFENTSILKILGYKDVYESVEGFGCDNYRDVQIAHDYLCGDSIVWDADKFLKSINALTCFDHVKKLDKVVV